MDSTFDRHATIESRLALVQAETARLENFFPDVTAAYCAWQNVARMSDDEVRESTPLVPNYG